MTHIIINVGRQLGSGGHDIGRMLALDFHAKYYDRELLISGGSMYKTNFSQESLFQFQSDAIIKAAQEGSCVFVGRCADYILREFPNTVNVFITASMKYRINQIMNKQHLDHESARRFIESKESKRASYYNYYTGKKWGAAESYDLCIDSSILGLVETEKIIASFIRKRFNI